ncbi:hypothetical protein [Calycomorphotria hydatis]|nr:hypothetical protein [Calycomorphotria hydatis]
MNAAHIHLLTVHVPVLGCPALAVLLLVGLWKRSDLLWNVGVIGVLAMTLVTVVAYFSGPLAYEQLSDGDYLPTDEVTRRIVTERIESHAAVARGVYFVFLLIPLMIFVQGIRVISGDPWPRWMKWAVPFLLVAATIGFTVVAHQGGVIRHPEILPSAAHP